MATLHIDVDCLNKDELLFELRSRGVDVEDSVSVDDLRKQFRAVKGTAHDTTKANTFISGLSLDNEFQVCEEKLGSVLQAEHSSSSCLRRCMSRLAHIVLRLEKLHCTGIEQRLRKVALVSKAVSAMENLKCNQARESSSQAIVKDGSNSVSVSSCHKHASQVLKWNIVYDGRTSIHDFIFRLEDLIFSSEISDAELLRNAVHLFSGQALLWYRNNKFKFNCFQNLIDALKAEFQPVEYERCLLNQIKARLQNNNESVKSYINIMEGLFLRLPTPLSESEQLDIILANISPYFISRLALYEIRTIENLKDVCARIEVAKFRCENRGFLTTGKESILPDFCNTNTNSHPSASSNNNRPFVNRPQQTRTAEICLKCGGSHHHSRCDIHPTTICFRCKRPGVITKNCGCSKN